VFSPGQKKPLDNEVQEEQERTQSDLLELPAGAAVPNGQDVHDKLPLAAYVLMGQVWQELEALPLSLLYCPAGQVYTGQPLNEGMVAEEHKERLLES
jgi:hypothetical protein